MHRNPVRLWPRSPDAIGTSFTLDTLAFSLISINPAPGLHSSNGATQRQKARISCLKLPGSCSVFARAATRLAAPSIARVRWFVSMSQVTVPRLAAKVSKPSNSIIIVLCDASFWLLMSRDFLASVQRACFSWFRLRRRHVLLLLSFEERLFFLESSGALLRSSTQISLSILAKRNI